MKKTLAIIAAAVMLLTVFAFVLYAIDTSGSNPEAGSKGDGLVLCLGIIFLGFILLAEIAFFYGIALILSKNRTPLKLVFGIVLVIITAVLLIVWIKSFLGGAISKR